MEGLDGLVGLVTFLVLFLVIALTLHIQLPRHEVLEPRRGATIATLFLALVALIMHDGKGRPT